MKAMMKGSIKNFLRVHKRRATGPDLATEKARSRLSCCYTLQSPCNFLCNSAFLYPDVAGPS